MSPHRTHTMTDTSKMDEQEDAAMREVPWMGDIHDEEDPPPGKNFYLCKFTSLTL